MITPAVLRDVCAAALDTKKGMYINV